MRSARRRRSTWAAAALINIKIGRVGGYSQALAIHDVCQRGRRRCGAAACSNRASAAPTISRSRRCPNFTLPGDISASSRYFTRDLVTPTGRRWALAVKWKCRQGPGLGIEIDMDYLAQQTFTTDRHERRVRMTLTAMSGRTQMP